MNLRFRLKVSTPGKTRFGHWTTVAMYVNVVHFSDEAVRVMRQDLMELLGPAYLDKFSQYFGVSHDETTYELTRSMIQNLEEYVEEDMGSGQKVYNVDFPYGLPGGPELTLGFVFMDALTKY